MKKANWWLIAFVLFNFICRAQQDTIFKVDGRIIPCTITLVNESSVFYKLKKDSDIEPMPLFYVLNYSIAGKKQIANVKSDSIKPNRVVNVDGVNINSLNIQYCQLQGVDVGLFKKKIVINIDYGQRSDWTISSEIKNEFGESLIFNSMVDALNFMSNSGWEYVNNYAVSSGQSLVYVYLLRRVKGKT